jgi:sodium-dependent dicarboxylate transporter 2/3/5
MVAAMVLFVTPAGEDDAFVMDWETARELPWGILILFGGGLSLAAAIDDTGIGAYLGTQVGVLEGAPGLLVVAILTALVVLLTELTSNTATTATFLPILAGIAPGIGIDPMLLLVPAAMAASCAFMLPVATPPNAIVFGSGRITIPEMRSAGIWLNVISVGLITVSAYTLVLYLLV